MKTRQLLYCFTSVEWEMKFTLLTEQFNAKKKKLKTQNSILKSEKFIDYLKTRLTGVVKIITSNNLVAVLYFRIIQQCHFGKAQCGKEMSWLG